MCWDLLASPLVTYRNGWKRGENVHRRIGSLLGILRGQRVDPLTMHIIIHHEVDKASTPWGRAACGDEAAAALMERKEHRRALHADCSLSGLHASTRSRMSCV